MSKSEPWVIVAANQINVAFAEGRIKSVNDTAEIIRDVYERREKFGSLPSGPSGPEVNIGGL